MYIKRTFALLIIICMLLCITFKPISNRMTYNINKDKDNYIVSISNAQGEIIYENTYKIEPIISKVGNGTIMIGVGKGDSRIYKFINGTTGKVSDDFENVSAYSEKFVIYGMYDGEKLKIIIRDIYDVDKFYREIVDEFPSVAVGSYVIKEAKIINSSLIYLVYYKGDDWKETKKLIFVG